VPIRLTEERWLHITEGHGELGGHYFDVLETVEQPDAIYEGKAGEMLAVRRIEPGRHLVAVYQETGQDDGFIVTAFLTKRLASIQRRRRIWPP
jgi:hypothetical protein